MLERRDGWPAPAFCYCKKFEIVAFSIIFLRKDAQIGEFRKHNAKRAISAKDVAGLPWGVAPVALTDSSALFPRKLKLSWVA